MRSGRPSTAKGLNTLTPKWSTKLTAFDVYIRDQRYAIAQTLRVE
jgi:hypothetical protein